MSATSKIDIDKPFETGTEADRIRDEVAVIIYRARDGLHDQKPFACDFEAADEVMARVRGSIEAALGQTAYHRDTAVAWLEIVRGYGQAAEVDHAEIERLRSGGAEVVLGDGLYAVMAIYTEDGSGGSIVFRRSKRQHPIGDNIEEEDGGGPVGKTHEPRPGDVHIRMENAESWRVVLEEVQRVGKLNGWDPAEGSEEDRGKVTATTEPEAGSSRCGDCGSSECWTVVENVENGRPCAQESETEGGVYSDGYRLAIRVRQAGSAIGRVCSQLREGETPSANIILAAHAGMDSMEELASVVIDARDRSQATPSEKGT